MVLAAYYVAAYMLHLVCGVAFARVQQLGRARGQPSGV